MTSLLYKEFMSLRTVIFVYLLGLGVLLFVTTIMNENGSAFLLPVAGLSWFFIMSIAAQEEKNDSHILINSLPVSRKQVVAAKYLFSILAGLVFIGIALMVHPLFNLSSQGTNMFDAVLTMAATGWFAAIYFPMYYWLGPRFVQISMFILFILVFAILPPVFNLGIKHDFWGLGDWLRSASLNILAVILLLLTAIVLLGSWALSARIYERKDL
jgi:ABC-type transport system involved in multi-copper enzyme maturation permease subunit